MADNKVAEAIDIVARNAAWLLLDNAVLFEYVEWGEYPDIGEHDWKAVADRIKQMGDNLKPTLQEYEAAYEYLASRADDDA